MRWQRASLLSIGVASAAPAQTVLFLGNSFTYGGHSAAWHYRPDSVHDLNKRGVGGVPALFKRLTDQAGLDYDVHVETVGGKSFQYHWDNKRDVVDAPWDHVIMQEYSTLDADKPGDPGKMKIYADKLSTLFIETNPKVDIQLLATWSRPDLTYTKDSRWHGKPIEAMARDLNAGYDSVAKANPHIAGVIPVGLAFNQAIAKGVADSNPYDGIAFDQVDLWTYDHYHASTYGYYLEALMDFQRITGQDPRQFDDKERAAADLGISPEQAVVLQKIVFEAMQPVAVSKQ